MIDENELNILRCPVCVREKDASLRLYKQTWLICKDCNRKYPIVDNIPIMLVEEGDKWQAMVEDDLPINPSPVR